MTGDAFRDANQSVSDESISVAEPIQRTPAGESTPATTYRTSYDASVDGSLDSAVVVAIAEATSSAPNEVEPLYETVDPDALANLFSPTIQGETRRTGTVSFLHDGCRVTVDGDRILVDPDPSFR